MSANYVIWFENLRMTDVESVGGKNASLGEMISQLSEKGVRVPGGFATTADAYRAFPRPQRPERTHFCRTESALDVDDVVELARWQRNPPMDSGAPRSPSSWIMKLPKRGEKCGRCRYRPNLCGRALLLLLPKTCRTLRLPVSKKLS